MNILGGVKMKICNFSILQEDESYDSKETYYDYKCHNVRFPNDNQYESLCSEVHTYHISELDKK